MLVPWYDFALLLSPLFAESYDDLDELTARYLEPIQSLMHKLVAHRKFRRGSWETLQVRAGPRPAALGYPPCLPGRYSRQDARDRRAVASSSVGARR